MRRIVSSDNYPKKSENLYDDFNNPELQEEDLYDELTKPRLSDSFFEDDSIDDEEDTFDPVSSNDINSVNDYDTEEDTDLVKVKSGKPELLLNVLRDELKLKECDRGFLRFKYRGEIYDGVPMVEINPSKFVFKIDDKMKSILLAEITIM